MTTTVPSNATLVVPTHVVTETTLVKPTFSEEELNQAAIHAIAEMNLDPDAGEGAKLKEMFGKLVPKWMLAMGTSFYQKDVDMGPKGFMGKYLQGLANNVLVMQTLTNMLKSMPSFWSLKSYMDSDAFKNALNGNGFMGAEANALKDAIDNFKGNGDAGQVAQECQAFFGTLSNELKSVSQTQDEDNTTINGFKDGESKNLSDEKTLGDFLATMSESFAQKLDG